MGYKIEESEGENFYKYLHPDDYKAGVTKHKGSLSQK